MINYCKNFEKMNVGMKKLEKSQSGLENEDYICKLPITVRHIFDTDAQNMGEFDIKPEYHCLYVRKKGRVIIFRGKHRQTIHEGRGILLKNHEVYHFKENTMVDGGGWMFLFDGSGCESILEYLKLGFFEAFDLDMGRLRHLKNEMCRCIYAYKKDFYKASMMFQEVLYDISMGRQEDLSEDVKMWEVERYIKHHFCENITLEDLAKVYGTSQSYFTRAYKAVYHRPPMQSVRQLRHERARNLLENTEKKIYDISRECGFDNCDYFCAVFKKLEGKTPVQYRREKCLLMF